MKNNQGYNEDVQRMAKKEASYEKQRETHKKNIKKVEDEYLIKNQENNYFNNIKIEKNNKILITAIIGVIILIILVIILLL